MANITIEIPEKVLKSGNRKLIVVDPKEFERDLRQKWEMGDAVSAMKIARQEQRAGKLMELKSLRQLMK